MSIIITNEKTLDERAIVVLKQQVGEITHEVDGDFTVIRDSEGIIGVNVNNFWTYFEAKNGIHTLSKAQKDFFIEKDWNVSEVPWFTVGEVIKRKQHPSSDKLFVLKVKTNKELQIVTNSLNSLEGKKVVVANIGAVLPSGIEIKQSKVMGVESEGMLCGGETLGKGKTEGVILASGDPGKEYTL